MIDRRSLISGSVASLLVGGASDSRGDSPKPGEEFKRRGDEIAACGRLFHTTAPVVLWTDPGGYDAYRVERRFAPADKAAWAASKDSGLRSPNRFSLRSAAPKEAFEKIRGGGWDLDLLRKVVDQFVIHFDARGTSRRCYEVLHDLRGLSVHFMLDLDGAIYQTLDLKEGAWHATIANGRSIGIEIANVGAYPVKDASVLDAWYKTDVAGKTRITIPGPKPGEPTDPARLRPIRDAAIVGEIQGQSLRQFDLTASQYDSLIKLTAALCRIFPRIRCDYPKEGGKLVTHKLPDDALRRYQGILGHYHVQTNKVDPGPAFQWDKVIEGARALL